MHLSNFVEKKSKVCSAKNTFEVCKGNLSDTLGLSCKNASFTISLDTVNVKVPNSMLATRQYGNGQLFVRYAYAAYPQCALYNKYKLPAGPFIQILLIFLFSNLTVCCSRPLLPISKLQWPDFPCL